MTVLTQPVLKLNRVWQAIGETNCEIAFLDLCRGAIMAMDTTVMQAIGWDEWIKLPIRNDDLAIGTVRGPVRVPRVVVCVQYAGRPMVRPRLDNQGIKHRDGSRCQYTGAYAPDGTVDHVVAKSRGGAKKSWRNLVWCRRDVNQQKGNKLPAEAGLKLLREPFEPKPKTPEQTILARHPDWLPFLHRRDGL